MAQLSPSPFGTKPVIQKVLQIIKAKTFIGPYNGPGVFSNIKYTDTEMIQTQLINWFSTNKGERIMFPTFGANLRQYLFEAVNENTFEVLEMKIKDDLSRVFPMVTLLNLKVLGDEEYNEIKVSLTYFIESFNVTDIINIMYNSSNVGLISPQFSTPIAHSDFTGPNKITETTYPKPGSEHSNYINYQL